MARGNFRKLSATTFTNGSRPVAVPAPQQNRIPSVYLEELAAIWETDKRMPSAASRRAWARARNLLPAKVNNWWYRKKTTAKRNGIFVPEETYELPVGIPPILPASLPPSSPAPETPQTRSIDDICVKKEEPYEDSELATMLSDDPKFGSAASAHFPSDFSDSVVSMLDSDDSQYKTGFGSRSGHWSINGTPHTYTTAESSFCTADGSFVAGNLYTQGKKHAYIQPVVSVGNASRVSEAAYSSRLAGWQNLPPPVALPYHVSVSVPSIPKLHSAQRVALPNMSHIFQNNERVPPQLLPSYAGGYTRAAVGATSSSNDSPICGQGTSQQQHSTCPLCLTFGSDTNTSEPVQLEVFEDPITTWPLSLPEEDTGLDGKNTIRSGHPSITRDPDTFSWCLGGRRYSYDGFYLGICECSVTVDAREGRFEFKRYSGCTGPWEPCHFIELGSVE